MKTYCIVMFCSVLLFAMSCIKYHGIKERENIKYISYEKSEIPFLQAYEIADNYIKTLISQGDLLFKYKIVSANRDDKKSGWRFVFRDKESQILGKTDIMLFIYDTKEVKQYKLE